MPYTLSHAAAVLSLPRHASPRLPLAALVAGSLAPDLLYFALEHDAAVDAHGPIGIFTRALPLGLGALAFFHAFLKRPAIALFPPAHRPALRQIAARPVCTTWRDAAWIVLAVLLGALTHVAWDLFTHDPAPGSALAFLRASLWRFGGHDVSLARVLQYVSSAFGLAWIAWRYRAWVTPRRRDDDEPSPVSERARVAYLALVAVVAPPLGLPWVSAGRGFRRVELVVVGATTVAFVFLCVFCAAVSLARSPARPGRLG